MEQVTESCRTVQGRTFDQTELASECMLRNWTLFSSRWHRVLPLLSEIIGFTARNAKSAVYGEAQWYREMIFVEIFRLA